MSYTFAPTHSEWLKIVNSVCPLFGREDTLRYDWQHNRMSDPAQRVCSKHVQDFVDDYIRSQNLVDIMDDPIAPSSPVFIVKISDLPVDLHSMIDKEDNSLPGYTALCFDHVRFGEDTDKDYIVRVPHSKARDILGYVEDWYARFLAKNFACAGCCMTLVTLAFIGRSQKVRRPTAIVGCPAKLDWSSTHGKKFYDVIATIDAKIPQHMKLSRFMKIYQLVPGEHTDDLRRWCSDCLFPDKERVAKEAKEAKEKQEFLAQLAEEKVLRERAEERAQLEKAEAKVLREKAEESAQLERLEKAKEIEANKAVEAEYLTHIGIDQQHHEMASALLKSGIHVKVVRKKSEKKRNG
jgi:hypothetical protein